MMKKDLSPLGAIVRGFVAGGVGSFVQNQFFRATAAFAPANPDGAFTPPEDAQRREMPTETVARRWVDEFMQRGPLSPEDKARAGRVVHYLFGAAWGAEYAVARESVSALDSPGGAVAFSTAVWLVGDGLVLPAFRLAGGPRAYPVKNHAYAWVAHLAYGLSVAATYELLGRPPTAFGGLIVAAAPAIRRAARRIADALPSPTAVAERHLPRLGPARATRAYREGRERAIGTLKRMGGRLERRA